jgi:hypothetical protein
MAITLLIEGRYTFLFYLLLLQRWMNTNPLKTTHYLLKLVGLHRDKYHVDRMDENEREGVSHTGDNVRARISNVFQ